MDSKPYSQVITAIQEMARVIHALILREIKTRFGRQRLGYIWAFLEPILFISVFVLIMGFRGGINTPGMGLELFLITGFVPFFMFQHIMQSSINALDANRQLLTYPQVQIYDIILARFLLEYATSFVVFVILISGVYLLGIDTVNIGSPLGVLAGLSMMALFGLGLGLCISSLVPIFPAVKMISAALLGRPLFFTSGLFFTAEMMPEAVRDILLLNPLFHTIELIRTSFFSGIESGYFNPGYTFTWLFTLLFMGLLMQRALHRYSLSLG